MVFTDYWEAYQAVIPNEQHFSFGKEIGETSQVKRRNNTLRQHLARFVRKTLSFPKSIIMHEICLSFSCIPIIRRDLDNFKRECSLSRASILS